MSDEAWSTEGLPPETVAAVRAESDALVEGIVTAVRSRSRAYADVLAAPEGIGIRLGIEQAIKAFLDAIEQGRRPARDTDEMWRRLGEAEFQAGRGLDELRAAFRTGTRAAWRGAAELALRAGVSAPVAIALAEAIFVYGDELATDVVEGYLRAQSDEAGERERRRRRLAALLLDGEAHDSEAIERAAELARWPVPRELAVLALAGEDPGSVTRRLDLDVLAGADAAGSWLILPDPGAPGRAAALGHALEHTECALGPAVAPREAGRSLRWARLALGLVGRGVLPSERPTRIDDHLAQVIVLQDEGLAAALLARRLQPLDGLPARDRERLLQTLAAWLAHQRHTPAVAAELHVHPQTVRYRIGKLRGLLGDELESPDGRFELELALRIRASGSGV
jgi:PucR C-terminal helix-turn-helix domain